MCFSHAAALRGVISFVIHMLAMVRIIVFIRMVVLFFFFGRGCRFCVVIITVGDVLVVVVTYSCNQLFSHVFGIDTVVMLHGCEPDVMSV